MVSSGIQFDLFSVPLTFHSGLFNWIRHLEYNFHADYVFNKVLHRAFVPINCNSRRIDQTMSDFNLQEKKIARKMLANWIFFLIKKTCTHLCWKHFSIFIEIQYLDVVMLEIFYKKDNNKDSPYSHVDLFIAAAAIPVETWKAENFIINISSNHSRARILCILLRCVWLCIAKNRKWIKIWLFAFIKRNACGDSIHKSNNHNKPNYKNDAITKSIFNIRRIHNGECNCIIKQNV